MRSVPSIVDQTKLDLLEIQKAGTLKDNDKAIADLKRRKLIERA